MRVISILLFAVAILCNSAWAQGDNDLPDPPERPDPVELTGVELEVQHILDAFGRMWEDEDMDTFTRIIADDADMVIIGTDAAEYIVGHNDFREIREQQYQSFENVEFQVRETDIKVSDSGSVAWFAKRFDLFTITADGTPVSLEDLRLTGVLEKRDDDWKIVQLHTSVPVEGQAAQY